MSARILVVDDDESGRYFKTHVLRKAGHTVIEAESGRAALAALAQGAPDLVLLDVKLPDMNGLDVCRTIKGNHPDVLVLQTSAAFTTSHDRAAGLEGGANSYLAEPVEADELVATAAALLRLRRAERELRGLADTLEERVAGRTRELEDANRQLQQETTERLQAEEALRQSQKLEAVGQLTGGVAHDFNNLLTVITANLELIEQAAERPGPVDKGRLLKMVRAAIRAAMRGEQVTQQLLAFARRQPLRVEVVELNTLIGELLPLLRQAVGEAVEVEPAFARDLWPVRIDPGQLEAALLNLSVNARDAMPDGGVLRIETRNAELAGIGTETPPGSFVLLQVADNGIGMSREIRERAFEPFYTTKDVGKGTGLGLSQVYAFVKQAGGHIAIESAEGRGTVFCLYLPRFAGEAPAAPAPATEEGGKPPGVDGARVLVVEDNADIADAVRLQLGGLGYRVVVAGTAREALDLIDGGEPVDLLFTDVIMPAGMNGLELARKAVERRPGLRVLLTSGYAPDSAGGRDRQGEFPLIAKPYRAADLAKRVRDVLVR